MKKLFMMLGFLALLLSSLSARYIFDGKIIFSKHATNKDSLAYLIIEKAGGVLDTFAVFDTLGNITFIGNVWQDGNIILDGDTIVIRDATKGDSIRLYHDGSSFVIIGDAGTDNLELEGIDLELKNGALIQNPHVDSIIITEAVTKCSGEVLGTSFDGDSLNIGDEEWLKKLDFGNDVFGDAKTADTVLITGATTSDLYLVTAKDSLPAGYWTTIAKVGSLIVKSSAAEDDTPFIWWRFK